MKEAKLYIIFSSLAGGAIQSDEAIQFRISFLFLSQMLMVKSINIIVIDFLITYRKVVEVECETGDP